MWKSLLSLRGKFGDNVCTMIGNGEKASLWHLFCGWFSQCYPRYAFILWMAIRGRLQTQDRIARWNPNANMNCPLCSRVSDSHSHLFFECEFSSKIMEVNDGKNADKRLE